MSPVHSSIIDMNTCPEARDKCVVDDGVASSSTQDNPHLNVCKPIAVHSVTRVTIVQVYCLCCQAIESEVVVISIRHTSNIFHTLKEVLANYVPRLRPPVLIAPRRATVIGTRFGGVFASRGPQLNRIGGQSGADS